ncbi:MAG TPA: hypothetical protein VKY33_00785, partial [Flavobacterium sp.]|nr:hypothetical protein [Flavobacterium sp.]
MLYHQKNGITVERITPERLSNGDDNEINIVLNNKYPFAINTTIIDELPFQFQERNFFIKQQISKNSNQTASYKLQPKQRGIYEFGKVNVFATTSIKILSKRYKFTLNQKVTVYPSFLNLRK